MEQTIQLLSDKANVTSGEQISVTAQYNVANPGDIPPNTLTQLFFSIHFDSSKLRLDDFTSFPNSLLTNPPEVVDDTQDTDTDPLTDKIIIWTYIDTTGNNQWPGADVDLPLELSTLNFTTLGDFSDTAINATIIQTSPGFTGEGDSLSLTLPPPTLPSLSINDVSLEEGDEGNTAFEFTVTLSEVSNEDVTVNFATADGTAVAGEDYTAITDETVTIAAGQTTAPITVQVTGDTVEEPDETFIVNLTNATNATIADREGTGTILNDDDIAPVLDTPINRFQNSNVPGTYLFAGEEESVSITADFPEFLEEGRAFNVADEPADDLILLNRFRNSNVSGAYLFATEEESVSIQENFSEFILEGPAFYVYEAGAGIGEEVIRFQNSNLSGSYLFAGEDEAQSIRANFPEFIEEGVAFEAVL